MQAGQHISVVPAAGKHTMQCLQVGQRDIIVPAGPRLAAVRNSAWALQVVLWYCYGASAGVQCACTWAPHSSLQRQAYVVHTMQAAQHGCVGHIHFVPAGP